MTMLCRCLRNRRSTKNLHLLPHQRVIENKTRSPSFPEEDESSIFLESLEQSCNNTFTNLLSRNFCDDDGSNDDHRMLLAKHKINNETFQNSYSRTNPPTNTSQLSTTHAQLRKRADTLGSASLTVAAALNINLSSLGPLYSNSSSSHAARKESSSSSSNRVSRAPSPAPENNRFTEIIGNSLSFFLTKYF